MKKPQIFAILVSERGSGKEVELCRVGSNPAAIVEACKLKMLNVLPKNSEKRIQTPRYDSVRWVAVSIAIAITLSLSPETTHATKHTASVEQCMTLQQARGAFSTKHLAYRIAGGRRCWSPRRDAKATKRAPERDANVSERRDLPVERTGARPSTFIERWILR